MKNLSILGIVAFLLFQFVCACGSSGSDTSSTSATSGVWVSSDGSDENPGSISLPFATLEKAMESLTSTTRTIRLTAGTFTPSSCPNLTDGASIYGGYGPLIDDETRDRDTTEHISTIDLSGCVTGNLSIGETTTDDETTIDGITVAGKSTTVSVSASSPTINDCIISSVGGSDREYGVLITADAGESTSPIISNSTISAGDSLSGDGRSYGIAFYTYNSTASVSLTITDSEVTAGAADDISAGISGSTSDGGEVNLTATGNTIRSGSSNRESWGIYLGVIGTSNSFNNATISKNTIISGDINDVDFSNSSAITALSSSGSLIIDNNFIIAGEAFYSKGIGIADISDADIYYNSIVTNSNSETSWDIFIFGDAYSDTSIVYADIIDNILCIDGGRSGTTYGILITDTVASGDSITALEYNLFCDGLTNLYVDLRPDADIELTDVASVNALDNSYMDNISGSADFFDMENYNLHIGAASDAIAAGIAISGYDTDIDGDARPSGSAPDIGADER